jgi:cytoskeleton protein RodZ
MNAAGGSESSASSATQANSAGATEALTPGELLRRERDRRAMSLQQAAEDLHLDPRTVQAIEENRFAALGVPVYARGHLRKYAALLGLSPEYIIQRYEALTDRPEVPTPVPASQGTSTSVVLERRSYKGTLWFTTGLIVLALGWWIYGWVTSSRDSTQPALTVEPPPAVESAAVEPAAMEPATMEPTTIAAPPVEAPPAATVPTQPLPAPTRVVAAESAPAASANDVRLRLEYNDASWTEVYDGAGRRLLFGTGDTGRVRTVAGTPPLRVTLGYASAVTVQVNDRSVVVPRQSGRDSARFQIAANGAVQMMSGEVSVE